MNIVWLDEHAFTDPRVAGGKAASLSRQAASFQVPPGFCRTTAAFDQALACGLIPDPGAQEPVAPGAFARRAAPLYAELQAAYRSLCERVGQEVAATAVRSSGVDEDGAAASFAGQH